jgi:hypothetical protein
MQTGACPVSLPAVYLSSAPYAPTQRADMRSADVLLVLVSALLSVSRGATSRRRRGQRLDGL